MGLLSAISPVVGWGADALLGQHSARQQMNFQKHMYKHRHQYEVADLKAAGLNPILSAMNSPSSPAGAGFAPPGGVGAASAARKMNAELKVLESQANKNNAEAERTEALASLPKVLEDVVDEARDFWDEISPPSGADIGNFFNDAFNSAKDVLSNPFKGFKPAPNARGRNRTRKPRTKPKNLGKPKGKSGRNKPR